MKNEDDPNPPPPAASFGPEQGAWSSPAQGIAIGVAMSVVLWAMGGLVIRLLWGWWQSGGPGSATFEPPRATEP